MLSGSVKFIFDEKGNFVGQVPLSAPTPLNKKAISKAKTPSGPVLSHAARETKWAPPQINTPKSAATTSISQEVKAKRPPVISKAEKEAREAGLKPLQKEEPIPSQLNHKAETLRPKITYNELKTEADQFTKASKEVYEKYMQLLDLNQDVDDSKNFFSYSAKVLNDRVNQSFSRDQIFLSLINYYYQYLQLMAFNLQVFREDNKPIEFCWNADPKNEEEIEAEKEKKSLEQEGFRTAQKEFQTLLTIYKARDNTDSILKDYHHELTSWYKKYETLATLSQQDQNNQYLECQRAAKIEYSEKSMSLSKFDSKNHAELISKTDVLLDEYRKQVDILKKETAQTFQELRKRENHLIVEMNEKIKIVQETHEKLVSLNKSGDNKDLKEIIDNYDVLEFARSIANNLIHNRAPAKKAAIVKSYQEAEKKYGSSKQEKVEAFVGSVEMLTDEFNSNESKIAVIIPRIEEYSQVYNSYRSFERSLNVEDSEKDLNEIVEKFTHFKSVAKRYNVECKQTKTYNVKCKQTETSIDDIQKVVFAARLISIIRCAIENHLEFWNNQVFFNAGNLKIEGKGMPTGIKKIHSDITDRESNSLATLSKIQEHKTTVSNRFSTWVLHRSTPVRSFYQLIQNIDAKTLDEAKIDSFKKEICKIMSLTDDSSLSPTKKQTDTPRLVAVKPAPVL